MDESLFIIKYQKLRQLNYNPPMLKHTPEKFILTKKLYENRMIRPQYLPKPYDLREILRRIRQEAISSSSLKAKSFLVLRNWLEECIPTFQKKSFELIDDNSLGDIFWLCHRIKFHRQEIFNIAEKVLDNDPKIMKLTLMDLSRIYFTSVNLKHPSNKELLQNILKIWIKKVVSIGKIDQKNTLNFLFFFQAIILNLDLSLDHKNQIIKEISPIIIKSLEIFEIFTNNPKGVLLFSKAYQMVKLYNIIIPEKLEKLLEKFNTKFEKLFGQTRQKIPDFLLQENDKKFFSSIFEKVCQNHLDKLGYVYDRNRTIKGNEYDLIIKGKNKKKYLPLEDVDIFSQDYENKPAISLQKLRKRDLNTQYIEQKIQFPEAIILDLNGPLHYTDSKTLPKQTTTRMEEFKFERLMLYGYHRYNIINHTEWQKVTVYQRLTQKYLQEKIMNPIVINIPNK